MGWNRWIWWQIKTCWCMLWVTHVRTETAVRIVEMSNFNSKTAFALALPLPLACNMLEWIVAEFQRARKFGMAAAATKWFWIKAKHICEGLASRIKYSNARHRRHKRTMGSGNGGGIRYALHSRHTKSICKLFAGALDANVVKSQIDEHTKWQIYASAHNIIQHRQSVVYTQTHIQHRNVSVWLWIGMHLANMCSEIHLQMNCK